MRRKGRMVANLRVYFQSALPLRPGPPCPSELIAAQVEFLRTSLGCE